MAFTITNRLNSSSGGAVSSFTTPSFTPSADSWVVMFAQSEEDGGTSNAPTWSITDSVGLTWSKRAEATWPSTSYSGKGVCWTAPVGSSPAAMTVTVDDARPGGNSFYQTRLVDVTASGTISFVQGKAASIGNSGSPSNTASITLVLDATPDTAGLVIGCILTNDNSGSATLPTGYSAITGNNAKTAAFYDDASASATLTCPDLGTDVYWGSVVGIELAEAGGGGAVMPVLLPRLMAGVPFSGHRRVMPNGLN